MTTPWSDLAKDQPLVTAINGADMSIPLAVTVNAVAFAWAGVTVTSTITDGSGGAVGVTALTFTPGASGAGTISLTAAQKATLGAGATLRYSLTATVGAVLQWEIAGQLSIRRVDSVGTSTAGITATIVGGTLTLTVTTAGMSMAAADARYAALNSPALRPDSGAYFRTPGTVVGAVTTLSRLSFVQYTVDVGFTMDRIGIRVTTVGAGSVTRLGIYASAANGYPGTLLLDAGTVDSSGSTGTKEITISQAIPAGRFWLAAVPQGGAAPQCVTVSNQVQLGAGGFAQTLTAGVGPLNTMLAITQVNNGSIYQDGVAGALPGTASPGYDSVFLTAILVMGRAV